MSNQSDLTEKKVHVNLVEEVYEALGPCVDEIIDHALEIMKLKGSLEARDYIINCLGPSSDDILDQTKGKVFQDDGCSVETSSSEEEDTSDEDYQSDEHEESSDEEED